VKIFKHIGMQSSHRRSIHLGILNAYGFQNNFKKYDKFIIVFYSQTDSQVNCLKKIFKFTLKLTLKQLRHVSVQSVTPSSGTALRVLAKVIVVKIVH
jgi:hypothetical protein